MVLLKSEGDKISHVKKSGGGTCTLHLQCKWRLWKYDFELCFNKQEKIFTTLLLLDLLFSNHQHLMYMTAWEWEQCSTLICELHNVVCSQILITASNPDAESQICSHCDEANEFFCVFCISAARSLKYSMRCRVFFSAESWEVNNDDANHSPALIIAQYYRITCPH